MIKVETETSAANIIREIRGDGEFARGLRAAATAVLEGECQFMPVVWAVDALGEAIADEDKEAEMTASEELSSEWAKYLAGKS